ncbi:imidazoleglycerol-phosphate dehydratase HisB [Jeotgalicoccus psychrophilus]|uniref:imidazoleglycerol-phosphate dehydratase HisB n=1 Tax=Jeotgalicoccus psychrophilus TaxID=157228 RepID=UPI00042237E2|nr:imidazoleglycerol-phosphate dehydratase HisB [Jeotgalicoccus psychrophilus]
MTKYSKDRETKETKISVEIDDEKDFKESKINTGIGFFDHMLTLFSFHSELYVNIQAEGDLHIDGHHTVEDIGIVLGQLLRELYAEKESYQRYGSMYLPMDESLARVVLDLSGRPHLSYKAVISREKVGDFDTELTEEFFNAVSMNSRMTLHIDLLKGGNSHHEIEAIFKGFARSLKIALQPSDSGVPSSKGVIE